MSMTADEILTLGRNFWESRAVLTAAELDLFSLAHAAPRAAADFAADLGGDERVMTVLLDAVAAMGLLEKRDGRYHCPPALAPLLTARGEATVLPMLRHQAALWPSWSELTGIVRGDQAAWERAHAPRSAEDRNAFINAMHVASRRAAPELVGRVHLRRARALLDVGGGPGTYTIAFLQAAPDLRATIFDLPDVIAIAAANCRAAGVADRVQLVGGDFYRDELPSGHDLALVSAIIHQNSRAQNVALFSKVGRALEPGGRIIVRDHVMRADRTQPRSGALFAINMLVRTEGGGTYTFDEIATDLEEAGFERIRLVEAGDERMNGLVEAYTSTGIIE